MIFKSIFNRGNKRNIYQQQRLKYSGNGLLDFGSIDREEIAKLYYDKNRGNDKVYSIISRIADITASMPIKLVDKEGNKVDDHWVLNLLKEPNNRDSMQTLIKGWTINKKLLGEAFIYGVEGIGVSKGQFTNLEIIPTHIVDIKRGTITEPIQGYVLNGDQNGMIKPQNIMFSKNYNPDFETEHGLSPLMPCCKIIQLLDNADKRNLTSIKNGGVARVLYHQTIKEGGMELSATPEDLANTEEELNKDHEGNYTKVLNNPVGVIDMGDKPADLSLLEVSQNAMKALCMVYNFPYSLYESDTTFNNQKEAKAMLYTDIGIPTMQEFLDDYTKFTGIRKTDGLHFEVDTDKIDAIKDISTMMDAYTKAHRSYNDFARYLNLSIIEEDWAEQPIFGVGQIIGNPIMPELNDEE